jgi:hypothetical protein
MRPRDGFGISAHNLISVNHIEALIRLSFLLPVVVAERVGKRESRFDVAVCTTELFESPPAIRLSGVYAAIIASLQETRNIYSHLGLY